MGEAFDPVAERLRASRVGREEIIKAAIWRLHAAGASPEAIAARVNDEYGRGEAVTDPASVAAWIGRQEERRSSVPQTRLQALSRVTSGIEILRGELAIALANFEAAQHGTGRTGAFIALGALCDFIEGFVDEKGGDLSRPLRGLMAALDELDKGSVHPMLEKAPAGHRTAGNVAWHTLTSFAASAVEAAMHEGMTLATAAGKVAGELHRRGYRMSSGKPITAATVRNWRARAAEGTGGAHDEAARRLSQLQAVVAAGANPPAGAWRRLLDGLDIWARTAGVRRKPPS